MEGSLATRDNWEEPILVIPPNPQLINFSAVEEIVPPWQGDHKWVQLIHSVGRSQERLHALEDTVYGRGHEPHLNKEDIIQYHITNIAETKVPGGHRVEHACNQGQLERTRLGRTTPPSAACLFCR